MVKKINTGSKLIPVIIDNCEVPECLHSTVWQRINNINNYDEELSRIVMSIFGQSDKPPIGQPPEYVSTILNVFPNLTKIDSIILKLACEKAIASNQERVNSASILEELVKYSVSNDAFLETLEILDGRGYIKGTKVLSGNIPFFSITTFGMNEYINLYVKAFPDLMKKICFRIVNDKKDNLTIATELSKPIILVSHVFNLLEQRGLVKFHKLINGGFILYYVSPELKRMLN